MIIKPREIPLNVLKLQALLRRTDPKHQKYSLIKENLAKSLAGFKGEASIDYPLSMLPEKHYYILHDIRLFDSQHFFQIDTILLSQRMIIILEVKNILGNLYFDQEYNQLIRIQDGKEESFPDPLIQIRRHEEQLNKWLIKKQVKIPPIYALVIISNPYSVIKASHNLKKKVIHKNYIPTRIQELEQTHIERSLSDKEIKRIVKYIQKEHTPAENEILKNYQITKDEINKGVYCPKCFTIPMNRVHSTWYCDVCQYKDKHAHVPTLRDYYLLFGPFITNNQFREFMQISSHALATRILTTLNLFHTGTKKGRVYTLILKDLE